MGFWETLGPVAIGAGQMFGGVMQNQQNRAEAAENRKFQERMSSTAHQREVEDLKKAGLNPILSANAGASSPSGAQAQMENAMADAASSAMQASQIKLQAERQKEEISLIGAQRDKAVSERRYIDSQDRLMQKDLPKAEVIEYIWEKAKDVMKNMNEKKTQPPTGSVESFVKERSRRPSPMSRKFKLNKP